MSTMRRTRDGEKKDGTLSHIAPDGTQTKMGDFVLEPSAPGTLPERVMDELRRCYREAKDYATAYGDAVKAQAAKYEIEAPALRRAIAALESDDVDDALREGDDGAAVDRGSVREVVANYQPPRIAAEYWKRQC